MRSSRSSPASCALALGLVLLGGPFAPRAHAQPALTHTLEAPAIQPDAIFGVAVAGVPDVDGDGFGDLVVGAQFEDVGGVMNAGRAHLYSGATGALLRTLGPSAGPEAGGQFGASVAGVPDVNGDGFGDVFVGAPFETRGSGTLLRTGRAYLFSGATGAVLRIFSSSNQEVDGNFGTSVAGVPDASGDGVADLLVGAPYENIVNEITAVDAGRAYLFSGATGAIIRAINSPGIEPGGLFGRSVAGVPDADGDGRGDVLVGALSESVIGQSDAGRAYLLSGATGALVCPLVSPNREATGYFGVSVSGVPDADGDGRGDLLVGAERENGGATDAGRAHLFSGATCAVLRSLVSPTPKVDGRFGIAVSGVPDADGDGRGDLLVGASAENRRVVDAGAAHLFSGATGGLLRTLGSPRPQVAGLFGIAVAGVPDASGDGLGDVLVGTPFESVNGVSSAGRAYLFAAGELPTLTLNAPQGWRTLAAPDGLTFNDLLGPRWTQGFPGADVSDGDPNVFQYNEPVPGDRDLGFAPIAQQRNGMTPGRGYAVYVFEDDDSFEPGTQGPFPKALSLSGISFTSPFPFPVTYTPSGSLQEDGWNLVGNPFDASMDWDAAGWTKTNVDNVVYVFDPALAQFLTWNGTTGSLGTGVLAPYQGFYVKAFGAPALTAPAEARTTGGIFHGLTGAPETAGGRATAPAIVAFRASADIGGALAEGQAFVQFDDAALAGSDPLDAYKLTPFAPTYLDLHALAADGTALDIAALPMSGGLAEVPLGVAAVSGGTPVSGWVTLTWPALRDVPPDWQLTLTDAETGAIVDLRQQTSYSFSVSGNATVPLAPAEPRGRLAPPMPAPLAAGRMPPPRLVLRVEGAAVGAEPGEPARTFALAPPAPNPTRGDVTLAFDLPDAGPARLALYDVLGREVAVAADGAFAAGRHSVPFDAGRAGLAPGLYLVRLDAGGRAAGRRLTVLE